MKHIPILILALTLFSLSAFAQPGVTHTYDAAGNRIHREIIPASPKKPEEKKPSARIADPKMAQLSPKAKEQNTNAKDSAALAAAELSASAFKVYPNPTSGLVQVETGTDFLKLKNRHAIITDMNGKLLREMDIATDRFPIDLSGYNPGTYILRISAEGFNKEIRIVRQ